MPLVHGQAKQMPRQRGAGVWDGISVASPLFERQAAKDLLQQGILERVDQTSAGCRTKLTRYIRVTGGPACTA